MIGRFVTGCSDCYWDIEILLNFEIKNHLEKYKHEHIKRKS